MYCKAKVNTSERSIGFEIKFVAPTTFDRQQSQQLAEAAERERRAIELLMAVRPA
uniref:hypothetical protein n=1 Tax=Dactylococcopsis salina TaxID=292566 RepID=UPI0002D9A69F|nr:hypothetical protein [Dactylococcopsis salina]